MLTFYKMEVKVYSLYELAKEEDKAVNTIKNHPERYIPIRIESKRMKTRKENGEQKRDYTIKYIKRKDLKKFLDL